MKTYRSAKRVLIGIMFKYGRMVIKKKKKEKNITFVQRNENILNPKSKTTIEAKTIFFRWNTGRVTANE